MKEDDDDTHRMRMKVRFRKDGSVMKTNISTLKLLGNQLQVNVGMIFYSEEPFIAGFEATSVYLVQESNLFFSLFVFCSCCFFCSNEMI
jgi:hypothetical protein